MIFIQQLAPEYICKMLTIFVSASTCQPPCSPGRLWWLHRLPHRDRRGRRCPCLVPLGQASSSSQGTHLYMGAFTRHSVSTTGDPISHMSYSSPLIVWFHMVPTDLEKCLNLNAVLKCAWFFNLPWKWEIFLEMCLKMTLWSWKI